MNYIQELQSELSKKIDVEKELLDLYTLLILVKGSACTLEDIHDAWSIWQSTTMPKHKSLIPFSKLSTEVQELDREYMIAVTEVALKKNKLK